MPNTEDFTKLLTNRRTCRSYKADPIPEDVMHRLYNAACSAPSAGGFQRITIIEIKEQAKKEALSKLSRGQGFVARAPVNLVFCVDGRRMRRIAAHEGAPYSADCPMGALWMGLIDAAVSAQTLVLAAEAEGLASCYNGNVVDRADQVSQLLCLPEHVLPAFMLTLGYPLSRGRCSKKYPPEVIVNHETYTDMNMGELYAFHTEKSGRPLYAANPERLSQLREILSRQYDPAFTAAAVECAQEKGSLTAYQYWFGCYYPSNEAASMTGPDYLDFLKHKGFDLSK